MDVGKDVVGFCFFFCDGLWVWLDEVGQDYFEDLEQYYQNVGEMWCDCIGEVVECGFGDGCYLCCVV